MEISPIRFSDEFTPGQFRGRENPDAEFMVNFKNDNLVVGAIVKKNENGTLIKNTMPEIYNPEKQIIKEQREIEKYKIAVQKKEAELIALRESEDYVGITTAANYRREYQGYIDRATMRLQHLRKQAPLLIDQSILQAVEFIKLLKEETAKAEQLIADAEKLKKEYEA